ALARAGQDLVVAGQRGHVLWSADAGRSWSQAEVPVSSDLVALSFPDASDGWAAGHDGVILHTPDGGRHWQRQLDGRVMGTQLIAYYAERLQEAALSASERQALEAAWTEAKRFAAQGAENPLLDIWFADKKEGWAVGAFGLILHTLDGGAHWQPLLHLTDNPKGLHLYAVRGIAGQIYVAGEQGLLLRRAANGRFETLPQPYTGTLFGITGNAAMLLIHGLRGNALRSADGGRSWQAVQTGLQVGLTASAEGADGRWYLASQTGHVLVSDDGAQTFQALRLARPQPISALLVTATGLVIAGPRGVQGQPKQSRTP
ncbi:MAG TPA: YCF48-related protein, partial [Burkholderiaceae bacterium]